MSRHNPPSTPGQGMGGTGPYEEQPVELERGNEEQPQLKWVVMETPGQSFLLGEDDYILDSYFNPQYDIWEVLIRLESPDEEE